ncbi:hypothetical protein ACI5KX_09670 [Erythrobacter sp. GH1-10]|uniref:hypothetical protein n=1 Tax=Erythrobacter sp. GH1-10 TaxID=3349334 RepID=UPI003877E010
MTAGYSGTPLAKKLSLKPGLQAWFHAMPETVRVEIGDIGIIELPGPVKGLDVAHVFTKERSELEHLLTELRHTIAPDGFVWASWPKKASKVETDITEDTIREISLPLGFVDVKVCAVDHVWSGLKLMIRKELR